ncbi:MAG: hypothetical protein F6K42_32265 [Leptolyngbya sp. SIO1D8]|nr:hypothetical protein [Leptolyngbya sp. SIO1D8]
MASSPYSSQALRFVIRQTHRLRSQATQTWRQTKLATTWSMQIVTATAYAGWRWIQGGWHQVFQLAHAVTSSCIQLAAVAQRTFSSPELPVDAPIRKILRQPYEPSSLASRLQHQPSPSTTATSFKLTHCFSWMARWKTQCQCFNIRNFRLPQVQNPSLLTPTVRILLPPEGVKGIATDLATGRLAWVTPESILVLSEVEHSQLQKQIVWELTDTGYRQRKTKQQGHLAPKGYSMNGARILVWIWQAILYFFGSPETVDSIGSGKPLLNASGTATFSIGLLPGLISWGRSLWVWITRKLALGTSGSDLVLHQKRIGSLQHGSLSNTSPAGYTEIAHPVPHAALIDSTQKNFITVATPNGFTGTWLDVPATVVGYGRSPLVWLLTAIDWLLVHLERLLVWIWNSLHQLIANLRDSSGRNR